MQKGEFWIMGDRHRSLPTIGIVMIVGMFFLLHPMEGGAADLPSTASVATSANAEDKPESDVDRPVLSTATNANANPQNPKVRSCEMPDKNVISVELPDNINGENSPFNFILDPYRLLEQTDAMRYGIGSVEEGATLLFHNSVGEYDFSRFSDRLTVTNRGDTPITVTVSASVSDLGEIELADLNEFGRNSVGSIYLAIVDDRGNEEPILADQETSVSVELASGSYSFGLTGASDPNADWLEVSVHPKVTLIWRITPAQAEDEDTDILNMDGREPETEDVKRMRQADCTLDENLEDASSASQSGVTESVDDSYSDNETISAADMGSILDVPSDDSRKSVKETSEGGEVVRGVGMNLDSVSQAQKEAGLARNSDFIPDIKKETVP